MFPRNGVKICATLLFVCVLSAIAWAAPAPSGDQRAVVYVARIEGMIDLGLAPFVKRILNQAQHEKATLVVLDIDTFGGRLDAAVAIRDALLESEQRSIALIRTRAISAGALIALAATELAMAESATIGAATPVSLQPDGSSITADEKTISYVRKEFAATAERRGRPRALAEAMVDPAVEIPGVSEKGKLLTLTTAEGVELGIVDFRADSLRQVLERFGLVSAEVHELTPSWAERVVRFITNPALASILMTIGLLGILVELRTPGFGVPGVVGLACLALFFWGHWIARLAGLEELALIALGIVLLAVELLVIPGFGVTGVLGIVAIAVGLGLSLVGSGVTASALIGGLGQALLSFLLAAFALLLMMRFLPRLPFARGVILDTALASEAPSRAEPRSASRIGQRGVAASPLRPAGIAELDGERVDVISEGAFVDPGEELEVVQHEGHRVVVRPVRPAAAAKE